MTCDVSPVAMFISVVKDDMISNPGQQCRLLDEEFSEGDRNTY